MRIRWYKQVVAEFAGRPRETLADALAARAAEAPNCPITQYLLGCMAWDRGRVATAVRAFMTAHRVEPQLQSAALLVFAGLSWLERRGEGYLPVLLDTWEEFRRPQFDQFPRERLLLDAFAEQEPGLKRVSPLAHQLWRLPISTLRGQLRRALASADAAAHPLLILPA